MEHEEPPPTLIRWRGLLRVLGAAPLPDGRGARPADCLGYGLFRDAEQLGQLGNIRLARLVRLAEPGVPSLGVLVSPGPVLGRLLVLTLSTSDGWVECHTSTVPDSLALVKGD
jgi:hypothetical protein